MAKGITSYDSDHSHGYTMDVDGTGRTTSTSDGHKKHVHKIVKYIVTVKNHHGHFILNPEQKVNNPSKDKTPY